MLDPYASHVRVLNAVLNTEKPAKVLEFGGGAYSTGLFLQRPHIKSLVCVETDVDWRKLLVEMYEDPRLRVVPTAPNPSTFDLVFIDNGQAPGERVETIRSVLSGAHPTVVIHDADVPEYAATIKELALNFSLFRTRPDTAVVMPRE